jgi:hypothetical protein
VFSLSQLNELVTRSRQLPEAERDALFQPYAERGELGQQRAYLGTTNSGASTLALRDKQGKVRVRLTVAADGEPRIEMLDASGRVVRALEATP